MARISFYIIIFCFSNTLFGQDLVFDHVFKNDTLKMRWGSARYDIMQDILEYGVTIELTNGSNGNSFTRNIVRKEQAIIEPMLLTPQDSGVYEFYLNTLNPDFSDFNSTQQQKDYQLLLVMLGLQENYNLSEALGFALDLTNIDVNATYAVNLSINNSNKILIDSIYYKPHIPLPAPEPIIFCSNNNLSISGVFDSIAPGDATYHVQRKMANENGYNRINNTPIIINYNLEVPGIFIKDSIGPEYYGDYQIVAKDIWGYYGIPSQASRIYPCHIVFYAPEIQRIDESQGKGQVELQWLLQDSLNNYLKGFKISRSTEKFGNYEEINDILLPPETRSFIDDTALPIAYYIVSAIYYTDEIIKSFSYGYQKIDTKSPGIPLNFSADFDTLNFTTSLQWDSIRADDLDGYRVFYSEQANSPKFLLTNIPIKSNSFKDVIPKNTLHTERYYYVTSRDFSQNESHFSDSIHIVFPDRFPPTPAEIISLQATASDILLEWSISPSSDVASYELIRTSNMGDNTSTSLIATDKLNTYIDNSITTLDTFYYQIITTDSAGLRDSSSIRYAKIYAPMTIPEIGYGAAVDNDSIISVFLDYPRAIELQKIEIRANKVNQQKFYTLAHFNAPTQKIQENIEKTDGQLHDLYKCDVPINLNTYENVQIRVFDYDGRPSPYSEPIPIEP